MKYYLINYFLYEALFTQYRMFLTVINTCLLSGEFHLENE